MTRNEDYQPAEDGSDSQRFRNVHIFKVGAAVMGGACLVVLSIMGVSNVQSTNVGKSLDLVGMPTSLRSSFMNGIGQGIVPPALASLPGGKWKELALASIEMANRCDRDVSAKAQARFNSIMANMGKKDLAVMATKVRQVQDRGAELAEAPYGLTAGMVGPVKGLWDPFKLSSKVSEGELLFFREAEITHGRVCMLASLGFVVQEKFHPLFGGDIDVPAIQSIGQTDLLLFWPIVFFALGVPEVARLSRIDYGADSAGFTPELAPDATPGDIGFDPLGLKPADPEEYLKRQNQELLHGRLAMIAAAGMIAQETFTQAKLNAGGIYGPA